MRVVDVRSFNVPSDENDYDELVAFADTMANVPEFDAIPTSVLDKIRAEIIAESYPEDEKSSCCKIVYLTDVLAIIEKYKKGEVEHG